MSWCFKNLVVSWWDFIGFLGFGGGVFCLGYFFFFFFKERFICIKILTKTLKRFLKNLFYSWSPSSLQPWSYHFIFAVDLKWFPCLPLFCSSTKEKNSRYSRKYFPTRDKRCLLFGSQTLPVSQQSNENAFWRVLFH